MTGEAIYHRILGCLALAGMGDALGAATEQWTVDEIEAKYGGLATTFATPPQDTFAGASGGRRGEVTDDASQMYCLARAIAEHGGSLGNEQWIDCLLEWASSPKAAILGQNTAAFIHALRAGEDVNTVGVIGQSRRRMTPVGTSNGAAIRVPPIGLVFPGQIRAACEQAVVVCMPTHDSSVAISAACSVASAVSEAVVARDVAAVLKAATIGGEIGERLAERHGRQMPGANYLARLRLALNVAETSGDDRSFIRRMERYVGNSALAAESVPAAMGIVLYARADPKRTIALAASMGNDTDSIATISGAIVGALTGASSLPQAMFDEFLHANAREFDVTSIASKLAPIAKRRLLRDGIASMAAHCS